jgi:hypothetical protein
MKTQYFAFANVKGDQSAEIAELGRVPYEPEGRDKALGQADDVAGVAVAQGRYDHIAVLDVEVDYFAQQVSSHRRA